MVHGSSARGPGIEAARASDRETIARVLSVSDLPEDIEAFFPVGYAVARAGDAVVGCAGLEHYDGAGLLRSVAVLPMWRGSLIGRGLVEERIIAARTHGLTAVYL